ncbi:MAG: hypothetical protein V5A57_01515 [Candidatus Paceibacterota bacterium]
MKKDSKIVGYYNTKEDLLLCKECFNDFQTQEGYEQIERENCNPKDCACNRCGKSLLDPKEKQRLGWSRISAKTSSSNLLQKRVFSSLFLIGGLLLILNGVGGLDIMVGGIISVVIAALLLDKNIVKGITKIAAVLIFLDSIIIITTTLYDLRGGLLLVFPLIILLAFISKNFWEMKKWALYAMIAYISLAILGLGSSWHYLMSTEVGLAGIFILPNLAFSLGVHIFSLIYFLRVRNSFSS